MDEANVTYIVNVKGKIIGEGKIACQKWMLTSSYWDVLYVEGLKHNLLSVSYVIVVVKLYVNQILVLFMMSKTIKSSLLLKKSKMFIQ